MKKVIFLKISNKTQQIKASYKRDYTPLNTSYGRIKNYPTITIKLNIEIPDDAFEKAQAELDLKIKDFSINSDIKVSEELNDEVRDE
jgi:hypothetical protein